MLLAAREAWTFSLAMTQSRAAVVVSSGVEYVLRSSEVACGKLHFELCDGTSTWTGALAPEQLTPPSRGISLSDFRSQLLKGLSGSGVCSSASSATTSASASAIASSCSSHAGDGATVPPSQLSVHKLPANADVELRWLAKVLDPDLDIEMKLKQVVRLRADASADAGLRACCRSIDPLDQGM